MSSFKKFLIVILAAFLILEGFSIIRAGVNAGGNAGSSASTAVNDSGDDSGQSDTDALEALRPELQVDLLDINSYSRCGRALSAVNGIVIHYTANPGSTAMQNRDYFNNLATTHETRASSHFVIGLEGEIVQCIPCQEVAFASNTRNNDTLAIECCIPDDSGEFNTATYNSLVSLTAWLMVRYDLTAQDVIRHYDVTGKLCPKYYVEHEDAWEQFHEDITAAAEELKEKVSE